MSLSATKTVFKNTIKNHMLGEAANTDPNKPNSIDEFVTVLADALEVWVTSATVTVPGTGLAAPGGGGPVTGSSSTGSLS